MTINQLTFWLLLLALGAALLLLLGRARAADVLAVCGAPITQGAGAAALIAKTAVVVSPAKTNFVAWKYPPNQNNYWWNLERCTNLSKPVWTVIISNVTDVTSIVTNSRSPGICLYRLCGRTNP